MFTARKVLLVLSLLILPAAYLGASDAPPLTPEAQVRAADQTFLTYPEWFLVFSSAEYADYTERNYPSGFPFIGHVRQFWQSYAAVYGEINDRFVFNTEYHVMINVIGVSTTVEYGFRAAYEKVFGRISAATAGGEFTEEDRLAAKVARDYIAFINTAPWYEFDFTTPLKQVWTDTGFTGDNMLRKWERKYALTTEYALKAAYGWLLGLGTRATFERPLLETAVVADMVPAQILAAYPDVRMLETYSDGRMLLALPRYAPFTERSQDLAHTGVNFHEIAGNRGDILISVITARQEAWPAEARTLFEQEIITRPGNRRVALVMPVPALAATLRFLEQRGAAVEHVFDY